MNIWYVSNSRIPSRNANSIHVMRMSHAYANLGHKVTLLVPNWKHGIEEGISDLHSFYGVSPNFTIRKVPVPRSKRLHFLHHAVLMPLIARIGKPTFIHSRSLSAAWGFTKLFRAPTILELHQPITNPRRLAMFRQILTSKRILAVVLITNALANHFREMMPNHVPIVVAPDGVDESWLHQKLTTLEARNHLKLLEQEQRVVVYTGHLYPGRGIDLIFQVASQLPDHLFVIVGGREKDIANYQQKLDHLPNVKMVGFKPPADVFTYLQAADVLLMPYSNKVQTSGGGDTAAFASPMKMFEYMAAGRPIVASDLPVLEEVLTNGSNALLLPYDRPDLWIDALRRLQQDLAFGETLGQAASELVKHYTWDNRAKTVLDECELS